MNYTELTGQESGVWIYKESMEAIICNWASDKCAGCKPTEFLGDLIWLPLDEDVHWEKKYAELPMGDWMDTCKVIFDQNDDDFTTNWDLQEAAMYESDDFVILAPKGWN